MHSEQKRVLIPLAGYAASVTLHDCGDSAAPTLLALHGFGGSGKDFEQLRQSFGRKVSWICPDFMGHGESESPDILDPYQLPAVLRLIDQARALAPDPGKVLLLGYSMGGRLALHYLRHATPMPALLIGISPGLQEAGERARRRQSDREWIQLMNGSMEQFCTKWEQQDLIHPQTLIEEPFRSHLASRRRRNSAVGLSNTLLASGTGVLTSLWTHLPRFPPLVLCYGSEDAKFGNIARKMQVANSRFVVREVPDSGHSPHLENPVELASLIEVELDSLLYR
ncbi:MAG: alpha/beta fold hydrolase [Puniceicoccaceae bacterium]